MLAKIGIKNTDSTVATAIRTIIVLIFSWLMVMITGAYQDIGSISGKTLLFLILSGLATGGSWLCYFKALQIGDVNKVVPIDKSSTILTMLLAFLILGEKISALKVICMLLIGIGTYLMITKKQSDNETKSWGWLWYAVLSAVFASLTVFVTGKQSEIKTISKRNMLFICLSGLTTGLSWLCYYKALQDGQASVVVPIDKLSILVTIVFSYLVLKEKITKKSMIGLAMITVGTLMLVI